MGFSLTGAHVIFFIAAVIVASTVSGIFIAITMNISTSLSNRGERFQDQLDTDFKNFLKNEKLNRDRYRLKDVNQLSIILVVRTTKCCITFLQILTQSLIFSEYFLKLFL